MPKLILSCECIRPDAAKPVVEPIERAAIDGQAVSRLRARLRDKV